VFVPENNLHPSPMYVGRIRRLPYLAPYSIPLGGKADSLTLKYQARQGGK